MPFASAFDSGDRDSLWQIMAADGMSPSLLRPSKPILDHTLQLHYRLDSWTNLASLLRGSGWYERPVSYFAYHDEILLLSNSYRVTQGLFNAANHHAAAIGMFINVSKTD